MQIGRVRPIDARPPSRAVERRIQRACRVRTPRGQHGGASYQRGEQMAKRTWLMADGEWLNVATPRLMLGLRTMARPRRDDCRARSGLWSSVALVIGITIGSRHLPIARRHRAQVPDPDADARRCGSSAALITLCGALSLAELAAALPETGGIYAYLREGWGRPRGLSLWLVQLVLIRAVGARRHRRRLRRVLPAQDRRRSCRALLAARRGLAAGAIVFAACANIVGVNLGALIVGVSTVGEVRRARPAGARVVRARRRRTARASAHFTRTGAPDRSRPAASAWRWSACCGPTTAWRTCRSPPAR